LVKVVITISQFHDLATVPLLPLTSAGRGPFRNFTIEAFTQIVECWSALGLSDVHDVNRLNAKVAKPASQAAVKPKAAPVPPTETPEQLRSRVRAALLRRRA